MGQSILVAFDGSDPGRRAVEMAATTFSDPTITVMHVIDPGELIGYAGMEGTVMTDIEYLFEEREKEASQLLDEAKEIAENHGVSVDTVIETGDIAEQIVEYADEKSFDHLVVGSHGRKGVRRLLLGSVAERIVRRAPIPVTVVR